jgi:hypothetical protein
MSLRADLGAHLGLHELLQQPLQRVLQELGLIDPGLVQQILPRDTRLSHQRSPPSQCWSTAQETSWWFPPRRIYGLVFTPLKGTLLTHPSAADRRIPAARAWCGNRQPVRYNTPNPHRVVVDPFRIGWSPFPISPDDSTEMRKGEDSRLAPGPGGSVGPAAGPRRQPYRRFRRNPLSCRPLMG